jgi:hypothetical protein
MNTVKEVKESSALGTLRSHAKKAFPTASVKIASDQISTNVTRTVRVYCVFTVYHLQTFDPSLYLRAMQESLVSKLSFIACRITTERDVVSCGV